MKVINRFTVLMLLLINLSVVKAIDKLQTPPSDTEIRQKIVGTWIVDTHSPNGSTIKGTIIFYKDGNIVGEATVVSGDNSKKVKYEGTWQVEGGMLIQTVTKSNDDKIHVG